MRDYVVVRRELEREPQWTVEINGRLHGRYMNEHAASLDAIDAAQEDDEHGIEARVMLRSEGTAEAILWTPGAPFPAQITTAEAEHSDITPVI